MENFLKIILYEFHKNTILSLNRCQRFSENLRQFWSMYILNFFQQLNQLSGQSGRMIVSHLDCEKAGQD